MHVPDDNRESGPAAEQPRVLKMHGFERTVCGCDFCTAPCRHVPGGLDPSDLQRLCPAEKDVFSWAEEHLRALTSPSFPILVPARRADGHCHWLLDGKCAIHANAPYGCAFFDAHMPAEEVDRRFAATIRAREEDAAADGLYSRVWQYLCHRGLVGRPGDREALADEVRKISRNAERRSRPAAMR